MIHALLAPTAAAIKISKRKEKVIKWKRQKKENRLAIIARKKLVLEKERKERKQRK